jgi:hypothetical protein
MASANPASSLTAADDADPAAARTMLVATVVMAVALVMRRTSKSTRCS